MFLVQEVTKIVHIYSEESLIYLDVDAGQEQLAVTFLIGNILSSIWSFRQAKKNCNLNAVRAALEASINILRKSRHAGNLGALMKI